jgi:hypothetical protein
MATTLPSWSTAPVFRNLHIGELAMTDVCGGRPQLGQAWLARVCESFALGACTHSIQSRSA